MYRGQALLERIGWLAIQCGRARPTHYRPERTVVIGVFVLISVAMLMAGCGMRYLGDATVLLTEAEKRTVIVKPHPSMLSKVVLCTEPSPDVAKAVAKSFDLSTALEAMVRSAELPAQGTLQAAVDISRAYAENLAQLTNRLATIQLLRDALYRACEAYANGALSNTGYAVILSRYDDLVVTLLTGELVAGNFGQSLAVLGTAARGMAASTTRKAQGDSQAVSDHQGKLDEAHRKETEALAALNTAEKLFLECKKARTEEECTAEKNTWEQKNRQYQAAMEAVFTALVNSMGSISAAVQTNAQALLLPGIGAIARTQAGPGDDGTNKTLHTIQRKFLENINADAVTVACITVLAEEQPSHDGSPASAQTTFGRLCRDALPQIIRERQQLLRTKLVSGAEAFRGELHSSDPGWALVHFW